MAENKIIEEPEPQEEPAEETPKKKKSPGQTKKIIRFIDVFGILDRNQLVHSMPFILFVTVLIMFYIGNSYDAESTIRKIDKIKVELNEKRAEFISTRSEVMFRSKPSEVAKAVEPMQIKEPLEPPKRIVVQQEAKK
jgi:hypothetical protein